MAATKIESANARPTADTSAAASRAALFAFTGLIVGVLTQQHNPVRSKPRTADFVETRFTVPNNSQGTNMDEYQVKGGVQDGIGKVKDAVGGLTGDAGLQAEGKIDQASGTLKSNYGAAADRIGDVVGDMARATGDAAQAAGNEAGVMARKAYDVGANAGQRVAETVKQQTLLSLLGTAALAYAIAFLVHSPSSPLVPRTRASRYFGR